MTFPTSYHAGFSTGANLAQATNFGNVRWLEHAKWTEFCDCPNFDPIDDPRMKPDSLPMANFLKKYQGEYFAESWSRVGRGRGHVHPAELFL